MTELEGKNILVVGLGSSGEAAARVLANMGASPVVIDSSDAPSKAGAASGLESLGVEVRLGVEVPGDLDRFELVVASPGVPNRAAVLEKSRELGLRVLSELELGYMLLSGHDLVAVTGTNGKTTTTRMIAEMLDHPNRRAVPSGNIGTPLVSLVDELEPQDVLIVEVSSFQLQNIETFHARVAVVLNLAQDHFDWHDDMDEYGMAKMRIVENMTDDEYLVYNLEDPFCRQVAARARGKKLAFGLSRHPESSIWLHEGTIVSGGELPELELVRVDDLKVSGPHNVQNVMAASAASLAMGEDAGRIRRAALSFEGLEHRCEPAGEVDGVAFYNDSKATNPHATLHAVRSFDGRFVLIMGGRNKGLDFTELARVLCGQLSEGKLKGIVLLGESADEMRLALERSCALAQGQLETAPDLEDTISIALRMASPGEAVLFSPACASFDMFEDYKARGRAFKEAVSARAGGGSSGGVT